MDMMQTNFVGVINVTNAILPHMRSRCDGSVVFIGSRSAFRNQIEVRVPSTPASLRLTRRFQLYRASVRCLCLCLLHLTDRPGTPRTVRSFQGCPPL